VLTEHRFGETYAHVHLGELYTETGDWPAAREHLTSALSISLRAADRFGQAASLRGLGELAEREGHFAAALSQLAQALTLFHEDGIELCEARTLRGMGDVAIAIGDGEAARALWKSAYELFAKLGVPDAHSLVPVLGQQDGTCPIRHADGEHLVRISRPPAMVVTIASSTRVPSGGEPPTARRRPGLERPAGDRSAGCLVRSYGRFGGRVSHAGSAKINTSTTAAGAGRETRSLPSRHGPRGLEFAGARAAATS
jgi:tetratricopeptide (TPR) repeat protein